MNIEYNEQCSAALFSVYSFLYQLRWCYIKDWVVPRLGWQHFQDFSPCHSCYHFNKNKGWKRWTSCSAMVSSLKKMLFRYLTFSERFTEGFGVCWEGRTILFISCETNYDKLAKYEREGEHRDISIISWANRTKIILRAASQPLTEIVSEQRSHWWDQLKVSIFSLKVLRPKSKVDTS